MALPLITKSLVRIGFEVIFAIILGVPCFATDFVYKKQKIKINKKIIEIELANTNRLRENGLMNRKKLGRDAGMLFVFESERPLQFWMKNTFIPLSIGFFDKNRKLLQINTMKPVTSVIQREIPTYKSRKPALYALEMTKGWFKRNKIKLGDKFEFIKLPKTKPK